MRLAIAAVALVIAVGPGWAAPFRCEVRVIKNVSADEDPTSIMTKGSKDLGYITTVRIDKKTGRMSFCGHGSYCYNSSALDIVSPCRFEIDMDGDDSAIVYDAR